MNAAQLVQRLRTLGIFRLRSGYRARYRARWCAAGKLIEFGLPESGRKKRNDGLTHFTRLWSHEALVISPRA